MTPEMMTYAIAGLAFIAITALGFAFAGGGRGKQSKRMKSISDGTRGRSGDSKSISTAADGRSPNGGLSDHGRRLYPSGSVAVFNAVFGDFFASDSVSRRWGSAAAAAVEHHSAYR